MESWVVVTPRTTLQVSVRPDTLAGVPMVEPDSLAVLLLGPALVTSVRAPGSPLAFPPAPISEGGKVGLVLGGIALVVALLIVIGATSGGNGSNGY